jgi:hypothetical protein
MTLEARDKNNDRLNRRSINMFCRCINELEVKEANLLSHKYTWSNLRDQPTLERINRWFCSVEWDEMHPDASVSALSLSLSNHCPILMATSVQL